MLRGPDPRERPALSPKRPRLYRVLEAEALRGIRESEVRRGRYVTLVLSEALQGWKDVATRTSVLDASLHLEPCPEGWMYSRRTCFFFSDVAKPWAVCKADCLSHKASLAVISNEETLNFILSRIDTHTFWIGLHKRGEALTWLNGESYTGSLLGAEADGECAFVQSPSISLSGCDLPRNWICTKEPYMA
ncbi:C-type lectin domain family 2 member L-like isoform X2 [Pleurodeles waltl]|uniref:C-type lectin domain family 2 member L-like isoform X2 n=1 Tax=Pleurodeles waltl TaxID=8319 RepID=UPI003709B0BE